MAVFSRLRARHQHFDQLLGSLVTTEDRQSDRERSLARAEGFAVLWLFHFNSWVIDRWGGDRPSRWSPSELSWADELATAWPDIREEVAAYLAATTMPHTAQVSGHEPDTPEGQSIAPMSRGAWRVLVLQFFGEWVEENAVWFPKTVAALAPIKNMTSMAFTALDPHSHLETHIGPNRGALRYQLPIIVPGPPGACRIRIEDEMVEWREGEPVLFDLSKEHEAWNDSEDVRVLLMLEVPTPLPWPITWLNRFTQRCYRFFPSYRGLTRRARSLAIERAEALRELDDGSPTASPGRVGAD